MSDKPVVHIGENSPQQIAYKLMELISAAEKRELHGYGDAPADREWILSTYAECAKTVRDCYWSKS